MFSAIGIGSGLDVSSLIEQLMIFESRNLNRLQTQESDYQVQLSAFGKLANELDTFKSEMYKLADMNKFNVFSHTVSDETVLSISTDENASQGQHEINITQMAMAHKLDSTPFTDGQTAIGATGVMQITVGAESFEITVDGTNNTLTGIRNLINSSEANTGVKASILNIDDGFGGTESRLVLASSLTGTANTVSVSDTSGSVAATLNLVQSQAAKDAIIILDGYNVTRSSNSIDDALEGVTINLLAASAGTVDVNISHDQDAIKESIQSFVDAYNHLIDKLDGFKNGDIGNEGTLRLIKSQLRSILMSEVSGVGVYSYLFEIGVRTDSTDGVASEKLVIDTASLDNALDENFTGVAALFGDKNNGVAVLLEKAARDFIKYDGLVKAKQDGLGRTISRIENAIEREERSLDKVEARYVSQFTALDEVMTSLQNTNTYLMQQLKSLENLMSRGK